MHKATLPAALKEELRARRNGRERVFGHIDAQRTALLVIDMQNAFVADESSLCVPSARGIVSNINRLATALRAAGGAVVWVRTTFSREGRSSWPLYFDYFAPATAGTELRSQFFPGASGHELWPELDILGDDMIVDKDRFSAFAEGASDLERRLRDKAVDTLVITGTLTNVCCESTARDAMMRDFKCVMVEDANAAQTDEDHLAGLRTVARVFADVMSSDELLRFLGTEIGQ